MTEATTEGRPPKPTRAIDAVRGAYRSKRRSCPVPEWGLTLHFGPLTTDDIIAVEQRLGMEEGADKQPDYAWRKRILLLIHKAELDDGSKAFSFGDEHYLRTESDFLILQRVTGFMYGASLSLEQEKKESATTPTSGSD